MKNLGFKKVVLAILIAFAYIANVSAYPNFIGYNYNACLACHYNPHGNGPLTDYGRAVGATAITGKLFYSKKMTDEKIAQNSGFLYSKPINEWLRPSFDYRGLMVARNYGEKTEEKELIQMQVSASVVLRLGPKKNRDKFVAVAEIGYAPDPIQTVPEEESNYRSREYYLGYRFNPTWGIYAGFMDKVYGIRLPDHIVVSRTLTNLQMNDQTHGLVLHYTKPDLDIGVQPFFGNMGQKDSIRQVGFTMSGEYSVTRRFRAGASVLNSKSEFLEQSMASLHTRNQFGKGSSIMAELGRVTKTEPQRNIEVTGQYFMAQSHIKIAKGVNFINTLEYLQANIEADDKTLKFGPGIQYFPMPGFEFRTDLYNKRNYSTSSVSEDVWDLTMQLHVWL